MIDSKMHRVEDVDAHYMYYSNLFISMASMSLDPKCLPILVE